MRKKRSLPIAMIGGAFRHPDYLWPETRDQHHTCLVGANMDLVGGIESRARVILEELSTLGTPVLLCGHSLGALVAYTVAQLAPNGLVRGTALVNTGMIGGNCSRFDLDEAVYLASNPFGAIRQMLTVWPKRPESLTSLMSAAVGSVPVGKNLENVLVVSANEDTITPPSHVREVAARVSGTLLEVPGGHDLPVTDTDGEVLEKIASHLRSNT